MKRINFYIELEHLDELLRLADKLKVSYAKIIRGYIEDGLRKDRDTKKELLP